MSIVETILDLAKPLLGRLVPKPMPLRSARIQGLTFSGFHKTILVEVTNRTPRDVTIEAFKLLAKGPRNSGYQPLDLRVLKSSSGDVEKSFGLQDGKVPAYAMAFAGLGHEFLEDRVRNAKRLEVVAISQGQVVWRCKTSTRWMRKAIAEAEAIRRAQGSRRDTEQG